MKILFLQQQRIKPKSPCPNFDLPYPHFQDSAFYSAHWTPTCSHFGLVVCRIVRSHTEPANRALAVCRIAPLTHRTGKPCPCDVQNCPIAHRTGEPCPCGVQNCPIAHLDGGGKRAHALHFIPDLIRNLGLRKLDPETSSR